MYHGSSTVNIHRKDDDGFITVIRSRCFEQAATGEFKCVIDYPFEASLNAKEVHKSTDLGEILNYFGHHYGRNEVENTDDGWTVYSFKRVVESNDA